MDYVRAARLDEISKIDRRRFLKLAGEIGYVAALAACGNNPLEPSPEPTPGSVTLHAYNATTGQSKVMVVEGPDSTQILVNAADLATDLGDVVTSEFAVRSMDGDIGGLAQAAGSQAYLRAGTYQVFVPATAVRPNGQSIYDCMPTPSLNGNKRDFVVGVLHKPGVDTEGLPMRVWTDAINELDKHMQADSGTRYGSMRFEPNAASPDFTVGFADEQVFDSSGKSGPAWSEGFRNAYMLGPKYKVGGFPLDYDRPAIKDLALEELFEPMFRANNICGRGSSADIGKALQMGDKEWGLNAAGVNLIRRNFTRAR